MNIMITGELDTWIRGKISSFISGSDNSLGKWNDEPTWAEPLVGFSTGADPIYLFFKHDIGEFYKLPHEFMKSEYGKDYDPSDLTVVSWILPQTVATKADHRKESYFPSERWARSRIFGEQFNDKLKKYIVGALKEEGYEAVTPTLSPIWSRAFSKKYGFASNWSERHAAYVSDLGTFGLSDGLITSSGKAMRTGSVIINAVITPTLRQYETHNEYCLFLAEGTCGKCMERCPIGAITEKGHDKVLCQKYLNITKQYVSRHYNFDGYGCGLCQTGVPCESRIPKKIRE